MSCDHSSECEECATRIRELELDLLAERDLRIGNMAKLGRAEWEIEVLRSKLARSMFRRYLISPLKTVPYAQQIKQRLAAIGTQG